MSDDACEFLNVEIFDRNCKILVSCVYNAHRCYSIEPFFTDFASKIIDYDFFFVCGDFNINLLHNDSVSDNFHYLSTMCGLKITNNCTPTRFMHGCEPSLLDVCLVSDLSLLLKYDQLTFLSDHDLLFCCLNIKLGRTSPASFSYYDYK